MKFRKLSLLFLSLILMISVMPLNAQQSDNQRCSELVAQQAWYTKLIKFDNFKGKEISGALNFELVPDNKANKKYYNEYYGENSYIELVPGEINYSYKIPFSSSDYVDPVFNELAMQSGAYNGNTEDLLNYAFLHEWGRIESSDMCKVIGVGKIYLEQFRNKYPQFTPEQANKEFENQKQKVKDKPVNWKDDPDSQDVIGWRTTFPLFLGGPLTLENWNNSRNSENHQYDFLGALDYNGIADDVQSKCLNDNDAFRNGTFKASTDLNLQKDRSANYILNMTMRPIAIEKKYDANGNIRSIEKPLISSINLYSFIEKHNEKLLPKTKAPNDETNNNDETNKIYRYILKEKPADGVNLKCTGKDKIVDVFNVNEYENCAYVFNDEESADKFYQRAIDGENGYAHKSAIRDYSKVTKDDYVQLVNEMKNIPVKVIWEDSNNKYKDRPKNVRVNLLANRKAEDKSVVLDEALSWADVFNNLPFKDGAGNDIAYTVQEESIKNYSTKITGDEVGGFVITNTHKPMKAPKTADNENLLLFAGLMILGLSGIYQAKRWKEDKE